MTPAVYLHSEFWPLVTLGGFDVGNVSAIGADLSPAIIVKDQAGSKLRTFNIEGDIRRAS
jgi:hypothetical protein